MLDANIGLPQPGPYITYGYWRAMASQLQLLGPVMWRWQGFN